MAVAVQVQGALVHSVPASEGIVAQDETASVRLDLGIGSDAFPRQARDIGGVIVAQDQVLPPVQAGEGIGRDLGRPREIAEMPDLVLRSHERVPAHDQPLVHLGDGAVRARIEVEHPVIAEMGIAGEEYRHAA